MFNKGNSDDKRRTLLEHFVRGTEEWAEDEGREAEEIAAHLRRTFDLLKKESPGIITTGLRNVLYHYERVAKDWRREMDEITGMRFE